MKTNNNKSYFSAIVAFNDGIEVQIDVSLDKSALDLTYDEVEDAICDAIDAKYGYTIDDYEDESPYDIVDIVINEGDESYPVIAEDADDSELKNSHEYRKYLVLPYATYSLTPEAKLWSDLKKNGIIDEDAEFDYVKYHKILEKQ